MPVRKDEGDAGEGRSGQVCDVVSVVSEELSKVRGRISEQLVTRDERVNERLGHIRNRFGKMLRPRLVLLGGLACGGIRPEHIEAGAIVEMIHTATLLHDDVIDGADSRRGAVTVNALWGNESAVLLGDFLLSRVLEMCVSLDRTDVGKVLAETAVRVCRGELLQNIERENWELGEKEYLEIIRDKTAWFFRSCCRLGGLAAEGKDREIEGLSEYGEKIGLAFQITDDVLDIVGDESRVGKTLGRDFGAGKCTLAMVHFLEGLNVAKRAEFVKRLGGCEGEMESVAEQLAGSGSVEYSLGVARRFCEEGVVAIGVIKDSDAKAELAGIAEGIVLRCA